MSLTMSHLPKEVPDPKDTLAAALATLEAAPVAVRFQVIAANFDESVRTADDNHSVLVYVAMPLGDLTMSNLEILRNPIYEEGVKYAVGAYNIPSKACRKLPNRLTVLRYCLNIYLLII